jgi:hypothetical protein
VFVQVTKDYQDSEMHFVSDNSEGDKDCTKELVGQIT